MGQRNLSLFQLNQMKKLILAITLFSCGTQQKLDKKALDRVKTNPELLNNVGQLYIELNPQEKDTVETYIKGETVVYEVPVLDKSKIDSIKNSTSEELREKCSESIEVAYTAWWNECVSRFDFKEKIRVDTFIRQLPSDTRLQKSQESQIRALEKLLSEQKGKTYSVEEHIKTLWRNIYIAVGLLILLGIIIGLLIKFKLFKNG